MNLLEQNSTPTILVGPVLDVDGLVVTSALTTTDFKVTKNGTVVALGTHATVTHDHNGHYTIAFSSQDSDLDTRGSLKVTMANVLYMMPPYTALVLAAETYDALVTYAAGGTSGLPLVETLMSLHGDYDAAKVAASQATVDSIAETLGGIGNIPAFPDNFDALIIDVEKGAVNSIPVGGTIGPPA